MELDEAFVGILEDEFEEEIILDIINIILNNTIVFGDLSDINIDKDNNMEVGSNDFKEEEIVINNIGNDFGNKQSENNEIFR